MPTLNIDDVKIHYQTFGNPAHPAVIFSNSLGTNLSMWQAQIDFFQADFYVICYDTRGHGQSSAPQGPYALAQLGQDVIGLLDHLNIQTAAFCGISMGGITGQWLAIHYPDRFKQVIVCNTAAKIGQESAWLERAQTVRQQGLQAIADTAAPRWFTETFIQNHPNVVQQLTESLAQGSAEGYASCCEALATADLRDQLKIVGMPVLVIAGQNDPVTTVADAQFIQSQIHNSQLFEIHASHISNIEQADVFNQALMDFIS